MHTLEPLPYSYNELEPFIDEQTMMLHHDKHHQTYVDKLNAALGKHPELFNKSVVELVKNLNLVPEDIRTAVRNHGGGHLNHSMLWKQLKVGTKPHGAVLEQINKDFGSFEKFKELFTASSLALFGSGWCWLVLANGKLEIVTTPNQDNPITQGKIPVLGSDLWEHHYYKKYGPNRAGFVEAFYSAINWVQVEQNYKEALDSI